MSVGHLLRSSYLLYFSQPAADRTLYKAVRARPVRSIVELGIGLGGRTQRLLEIAAWRKENLPLRYTGIDLFEARPRQQAGHTLKQAHALLRSLDVRVQLVPGEPYVALAKVANSLAGTDLLLISADQDRASLARSWPWIPRMLTDRSLVFLQDSSGPAKPAGWRQLPVQEIVRLAAEAAKAQRRAA